MNQMQSSTILEPVRPLANGMENDQEDVLKLVSKTVAMSLSSGSNEFYPLLAKWIKQITNFDEILVFQFCIHHKPKLVWRSSQSNDDSIQVYLNSAHVLDPFYRMGMDQHKKGFFQLSAVAPNDYSQYESYYNSYFRHLKIIDEIGYLIQLPGDSGFIHIEMANFAGSPLFGTSALNLLEKLYSTVELLVCKHHMHFSFGDTNCIEHNYIEEFHRKFATEVCTKREHEVVLLMLQGYSVKEIAQQLSLGGETIKMHRKNIYAKLGIGSQPELLALFIDLLSITEPPIVSDPLVAVLEKKNVAVLR